MVWSLLRQPSFLTTTPPTIPGSWRHRRPGLREKFGLPIGFCDHQRHLATSSHLPYKEEVAGSIGHRPPWEEAQGAGPAKLICLDEHVEHCITLCFGT
jgi:hypothetical protein